MKSRLSLFLRLAMALAIPVNAQHGLKAGASRRDVTVPEILGNPKVHDPLLARVLVLDDVLATGGTAQATAQLVEKAGGEVVGFSFLIELEFLKGREKISRYPIHSLIKY